MSSKSMLPTHPTHPHRHGHVPKKEGAWCIGWNGVELSPYIIFTFYSIRSLYLYLLAAFLVYESIGEDYNVHWHLQSFLEW